jgi:hypothetical protein
MRPGSRIFTPMRNPDLAGHTHHRPPSEPLHEKSTNQHSRRCCGQSRLQHVDRLSHRAGPTTTLAEGFTAGLTPSGSAGGDLEQRNGADAQSRSRPAIDCRVCRDAPATPGPELEGPPDAGAPDWGRLIPSEANFHHSAGRYRCVLPLPYPAALSPTPGDSIHVRDPARRQRPTPRSRFRR